MKRFITCLALVGSLFAGNAFADANRAQYVPDIVVTEPGAVQTDIRAYGSNLTDTLINTTIGSTPTTLIISEDTTANGTQTLPATVTLKFVNGAKIILAGGDKLTIKGPIEAGPYQIFDDTDAELVANYVVFADNPYIDKVYPQWWGANGKDASGITDDYGAIQNAVYAAAGNGGGTIFYTPGIYYVDNTINGSLSVSGAPVDGMTHLGYAGRSSSRIILLGEDDEPVLLIGDADHIPATTVDTKTYGSKVANLFIQRDEEPACMATTSCTKSAGIFINYTDNTYVDNVYVYGLETYPSTDEALSIGVYWHATIYGAVKDSHIFYCGDYGIYMGAFEGGTAGGLFYDNFIEYCGLEGTTSPGVGSYAAGIGASSPYASLGFIWGNWVFGNYIGVSYDTCSGPCKLYHNDIDTNAFAGVLLNKTASILIKDNWFSNNGTTTSDYAIIGIDATESVQTNHIIIEDNLIYGKDLDGDGSGTARSSGIYIGDWNTDYNIIGNFFGAMRNGIYAKASNGVNPASIVAIGNTFENSSDTTIAAQVDSSIALHWVSNVSGMDSEVVGSPNVTYSAIPFYSNYTTLQLLSPTAGNSGALAFPDTDHVYNWTLQAYDDEFVVYVDANATTRVNIYNDNTGDNTDLTVDGAIAGGIEYVIMTAETNVGTASLNTLTTVVTTDADAAELDTLTLPNGTYVGQIKIINVAGLGDVGDTLAISADFISATLLTFDPLTIGDGCVLIWSGTDWIVIVNTEGAGQGSFS